MKKTIFLFFFILPFLPIFKFINPEKINYSAYFAIILLIYLLLMITRKIKIRIDSYTIYWGWFLFITFISWPISFLIKNYGYLTYPSISICLYLLLRYYCNIKDYEYFLHLFLITAFIQSLLGISQSFLGIPIFNNIIADVFISDRNYLSILFPSINSFVKQGSGTFEHFNGLGAYLALSFPIAYGYWKETSKKLALFLLIIIGLGIITTYSRGALLGSLIGIIYVIYLTSKKRINIIIFAAMFILFIPILWGGIIEYYNISQNYTSRLNTWFIAYNQAITNPIKMIYGYGPFYFKEKILGLYGTLTNLHSGHLQILLELGIIGFILFITLFLKAMRLSNSYKGNISIVSITGGLLAFFVHQIFDNSFFGNTGILWFSLLGIIFSIKNQSIWVLKN